MIGAQVLVREYNNFPEDFKNSLRTLMPGEVVKVKLNPTLWGKVKETQFANMNSDTPIAGRINVVTERTATRWLPCPWSVNTGKGVIQVGFLQGYNTVDNSPMWRDRFFVNGEMVFDGNIGVDVEDFYALQVHPECRKPDGSGKFWKFYIDNPEESAENNIKKIEWRNNVQNRMLALTDDQLKKLASNNIYGRTFLNLPTHNTPKSIRGYLANLLSNDAGYVRVNSLINNLSEVQEIDLIERALNNGKLICSDHNLKRSDNFTLCSFAQPLEGNTAAKATKIYELYKQNPQWKNDVSQWLRDEEKKSPAGGKRAAKIEDISGE